MKRAKLNNDKIIALYCRLSKDDGTNNESISISTREPIIEQNRWNNVQKILQSRPPVIGESSSGYDNIFREIIKLLQVHRALESLE